MTQEDERLQAAVVDQINAELGASGLTMKAFASKMGRPYDSTRNYLRKERALPFGIFFEMSSALDVAPDEIIRRARQRM
ncbi:hypothetical protein [Microbacterium karelineae]|uniref:hypothetical protein n=1 Tax=Microbacterium karelineae TaxID=2654283 RepID=UPI0012EA6D85|nr:hypothetical protein [Microbacterium karelineae]